MARQQQQRLLAAHAAAERVDPLRSICSHGSVVRGSPASARGPRSGRPSPTSSRRACLPRALRADHREHAAAGQGAPEVRVRARADAAAVRRDHERERRVRPPAVPGGQHDVRACARARRARVVDLHPPDRRSRPPTTARPAAAVADDDLEPGRCEPLRSSVSPSVSPSGSSSGSPFTVTDVDALAARQPDAELQRLRSRPSGHVDASRRSCRCARRASTRPARSSSARAERRSGVPRGATAAASRTRARARRRALRVAALVHEQRPQRLEERRVARPVRRQVHRAEAARRGAARRSPPRRRRTCPASSPPRAAVEAEHELVGGVAVGQEARDVDAVDLVGAGDGERRGCSYSA